MITEMWDVLYEFRPKLGGVLRRVMAFYFDVWICQKMSKVHG